MLDNAVNKYIGIFAIHLWFNKGKDNKAFTKFKDGWIMGTNAMFIPKMFCTNFMFTLGSKIKALDRP